MLYKKLIAFFVVLGLTACGLTPLYGESQPEIQEDLSSIKINMIRDRNGQIMRNTLLQLLQPYGFKAPQLYTLSVQLTYATSGIAFLQDDTANRMRVSLTVNFDLTDKKGASLAKGSFVTTEDYNVVLSSDYSTVVSEETAKTRAAETAAGDLKLRLADYFLGRLLPETSEKQKP